MVASDVGGLTSLIDEGETGYLVDERDATHWADVVELALDPERAMALSNAAVMRARRYTWRRAAQSLAELIEHLAATNLVHC